MNVWAYFSYLTLKIISKEMFLTEEGKVQKLQKKKKKSLRNIQASMEFIPEPPG